MKMHNRVFLWLGDEVSVRVQTRRNDAVVLSMKRPKTDKFRDSVTYKGPNLWSDLPAAVMSLSDTDAFKKNITELIRDEFYTWGLYSS